MFACEIARDVEGIHYARAIKPFNNKIQKYVIIYVRDNETEGVGN
jgi:hypothetical protein